MWTSLEMDADFRLEACARDTRFVLLSNVIDAILAGDIGRDALDQHFDRVEWDASNCIAKCSFGHATLSCVAIQYEDGAVVAHEFA